MLAQYIAWASVREQTTVPTLRGSSANGPQACDDYGIPGLGKRVDLGHPRFPLVHI